MGALVRYRQFQISRTFNECYCDAINRKKCLTSNSKTNDNKYEDDHDSDGHDINDDDDDDVDDNHDDRNSKYQYRKQSAILSDLLLIIAIIIHNYCINLDIV